MRQKINERPQKVREQFELDGNSVNSHLEDKENYKQRRTEGLWQDYQK